MKKCAQSDIFWNLQQMNAVTRHFCWHLNFVPLGLSAPAPGLYTCIKSWTNCIKSDFKVISFETCNKWPKMLTSKFCPQGVVSPCPGAIYMYKIVREKKCIKSEFKETCLKIVSFCWHQNFVPRGCLPLTCDYIHLLNHENMCIKSEILLEIATNDHSDEAFLLTSKFWH